MIVAMCMCVCVGGPACTRARVARARLVVFMRNGTFFLIHQNLPGN